MREYPEEKGRNGDDCWHPSIEKFYHRLFFAAPVEGRPENAGT
jgi:hypothetical protein